jgi:hypothetical protein
MIGRAKKGGPFAQVPVSAACDRELGPVTPLAVLIVLCKARDNETGISRIKVDTIAKRLRTNERSVQRALRKLEARQHIEVIPQFRNGRQITNLYQVLYWPLPDLPEANAGEGASNGGMQPSGDKQESIGEALKASVPRVTESVTPPPKATVGVTETDTPETSGSVTSGVAESVTHGGVGNCHPVLTSINRPPDSEEEEARAREASSSATDTDMSDEGQALLIYDELAGRLAWPKAGHLTSKERKAMTARLRDAGGLNGWRVAMEKAEESNYLARTKPDLRFFLAEDKFAQLMRGRYDPEYDKRKRPSTISDMFKGIAMPFDWPSNNEEPQRLAEPEPEPAPPPPPSRLTRNLSTIGLYANKSAAEMQALADAWMQRLEAASIDPSTAREMLSNEARMAPKSWSGLKWLEDRITLHVQKRQQP